MSDTTSNLLLPYILAAQAQKHVTHNEALRILDGLIQLSVLDRDLTAPPGSPADGDRYIVASGGTGDWAGWDLNVALFTDGAWLRLPPRTGWRAWISAWVGRRFEPDSEPGEDQHGGPAGNSFIPQREDPDLPR